MEGSEEAMQQGTTEDPHLVRLLKKPEGIGALEFCDGSDLHGVFVLCKALFCWVGERAAQQSLQNLPCITSRSQSLPPEAESFLRKARLFLYLNHEDKLRAALHDWFSNGGQVLTGLHTGIRNTMSEELGFDRDEQISFALFAFLTGRERCRTALAENQYMMRPEERAQVLRRLLSQSSRLDVIKRLYEEFRQAQGSTQVYVLHRRWSFEFIRAVAVNKSRAVVM
uniref:Uncharacterized protein n=1 Tax=Chromera velia CCMP2878 TaxID=1169474 RepID=A0A0G4ICI1_9ALVE|mmetsp:Transcript_23330/g.45906  ORF Transcript_23330/g.45906 Transcript_23330/m.45906 type:complete len:225 (-) Transcript_23330:399-1073(-)|eukprot:Cvel_13039.t1-p1 / transcript=Cvel_13039.t1 / gene=Cvel_13039 / organism=Chromera_velia_CCMP2878 / gene_product=hypothetical protein / transcript_product=hypothetical protein / location=Cvel_scaffold876:1291-2214(+) / protein_length=224 / sequence_SO=supercontig / SO=protein_coding / is_pseudo=false